MDEVERRLIGSALIFSGGNVTFSGGNVTEAAALLGLSRTALSRRVEKIREG